MTINNPIELRFDVNGMTFAAQEWGDPQGVPVLALHGWLDNSNSFYKLAPLLTGIRLIAIDKAGHGETDHRPGFTPYGIWEDVSEVFGVAKQLGWDKFSLLGHSRGAVISCLFAGAFPEKIESVVLLDGFAPEPIPQEQAPAQLAKSILEHQRKRTPPLYENLEKMIEARQKGFWTLSREASEALLERGVRREQGGYCWNSDPRLMNASPLKLSRNQVQSYLQRMTMPVKLLLAEEGLMTSLEKIRPILETLDSFDVDSLPGGHHFHMEEQAQQVADCVNDFFHQKLQIGKAIN